MKNIIFLVTFLISLSSFAQKNKPKNFEIVSYDILADNKIEINSYSTISEKGELKVYINGSRGKAYYAYQLNENEIKNVNKLYKDNLESFIAKKEMDKNHFYAGDRNYVSFQKNGKHVSLCYILPFMNLEFNETLNLLRDKIYKQSNSAKISEFNIDFKKIENNIIQRSKIDNYLPQKQLPPPPMMPKK